MATTKSYSNLKSSSSAWNDALRNFGIVTVMNAKVYDVLDGMSKTDYLRLTASGTKTLDTVFTEVCGSTANVIDFSKLKADGILTLYLAIQPIATLKYLKTANASQEGPTKTITGGQNASTILKYGKKARLEMTDALGNAEVLEALCGMTVEYFRNDDSEALKNHKSSDIIHATTKFASPKTIIGDTFIVDTDNGTQALAYIMFYDFLSDALFNLTQDAEGDATVFDMNGDLNEVKIKIGDDERATTSPYSRIGDDDGVVTGVFYTILPQLDYVTNPNILNPVTQG